ncbi:MAG TPA: substrate-binding domain-containing protein [Vicinamibacterales bacterium]|jgi:fructose transport system substrate-binding protein|nr:substrate-binding domain-containing protein [Vicinamibacterales bacterium]
MRDPQRHPTRPSWRTLGLAVALIAVVVTTAALVAAASATTSSKSATIKVGLITKDATNPFFVKMRAGATQAAKKLGAKLSYAAGKSSSDNASQIAAIENMTTAGVKGILITVADGKAENAAIAKARKRGVIVIALDSPTVPPSATNALFATNNFNAGVLIGKYARAATKGKKVTIAMLDEHAGSSVGALRHNGFLKGFGIKSGNSQIACVGNGEGQVAPSQTAMENCLQKNPNINVVYTINEPSAAGAWTALKSAGKTQANTTIVSVDGGCAGVRNVKAGVIDATSQQYPLLMASRGVAAVVKYAKTGKKPHGYTDTGVNLIAKKALAGVTSKTVAYGLKNCWG